jgi:hypothetical protein
MRNVYAMTRPDGHFLITVPFLLKVHGEPVDCTRWTEVGLKHLLAEGGFPLDQIKTGSWGNRRCVKASFRLWPYHYWWRSLKNEPDFPVVTWALARR